jgi:hypothetical protein
LAACGIGAAVYFFLGEPCGSGTRTDGLYVGALLLGAASFVFITRGARRWWWGLAAGVGTTVASALLLVILAILHHGPAGGCWV